MGATTLALDPRPVARTRGLRRLVSALDRVVESTDDPAVIAARTAVAVGAVLDDDALLEQRHRLPAADRYRQHVVHVHPSGLYSIVALVWKPGQATAIHDHRCWCVVGVWRGLERETSYDLHVDVDAGEQLVERDMLVAKRGDVCALVPPVEDIHRVENCGDDLAISLHVYGADIAATGTSINRTFADDLVGETAPSGPRASWRALETARHASP
jgi:3-mercaptopropionate dioxygenase